MKNAPLIIPIVFILFLASGCYYNNEEALYYQALTGDCDTSVVTYTVTIAPIMTNYCTSCHGADATGGYDLRTYTEVSGNIEIILSTLNHEPGYEPMPNGSKLDNCTINKVEVWKNKGMPK